MKRSVELSKQIKIHNKQLYEKKKISENKTNPARVFLFIISNQTIEKNIIKKNQEKIEGFYHDTQHAILFLLFSLE